MIPAAARYLLFVGAVIIIDQAMKVAVLALSLPYTEGALYHPLLALAVTLGALWGLLKSPSAGLALIVGGGLSNLTDVAVHGQVLDIFVVKNLTFNLADVFIFLGFLIVAAHYFRRTKYKAQ